MSTETSPTQQRQELIEKYWAGDMARKVYLVHRQRKAILENCRRRVGRRSIKSLGRLR